MWANGVITAPGPCAPWRPRWGSPWPVLGKRCDPGRPGGRGPTGAVMAIRALASSKSGKSHGEIRPPARWSVATRRSRTGCGLLAPPSSTNFRSWPARAPAEAKLRASFPENPRRQQGGKGNPVRNPLIDQTATCMTVPDQTFAAMASAGDQRRGPGLLDAAERQARFALESTASDRWRRDRALTGPLPPAT